MSDIKATTPTTPDSPPAEPASDPLCGKSMTAREFLAIAEEAGIIGMWADRDDIGDSSEFARKLRKRAETRHAARAEDIVESDARSGP